MNLFRRYAVPLNLLVIAVTIVFVGAALVVGRAAAAPVIQLDVGSRSPQEYKATDFVEVLDEAATSTARDDAELTVRTVFSENPQADGAVQGELQAFLRSVREGAYVPVIETSTTTNPNESEIVDPTDAPTDSSEAPDGSETTTTEDGATTTTTTTTLPEATTTTAARFDQEDQVEALEADFARFGGSAIGVFVEIYNFNLDQVEAGDGEFWSRVEERVIEIASDELAAGIRDTELPDVKNELIQRPPSIFISGLNTDQRTRLQDAAAKVVSDALQANRVVDQVETDIQKELARSAVDDQFATFFSGQQIAAEGDALTQVQLNAINELGLIEREPGTSRRAIVILGALTVVLAAFFLWRLSPGQWSEPKHFALLGILLVLAALSSRIPELADSSDGDFSALGFAIPAMLFGYVAAILYDPRTAVLMAVPVTTFVAISTADPAITVFAAGATVAPVAFVSSVSSRRQLRVAVALSALVLVPFAAAIAWLFRGTDANPEAAFFALVGGIIAGLIAQGLVSFLENLFRITTTLTLLDLVDRNHPALRLIEEKAPGTFNHSILVGTLAGKAAREIGADPLLAQAAAFYHDLGKTEDPAFFIENQFSVSNPHDQLDPVESCKIIRSHVTDGLRLARQYRLPPEISDGIKCHHGTGLMRYFYHQGVTADPDVDPQVFRHHGEKPKKKELAILMICDAVEGAARAHAQEQDPTAESITKVVDAVVGEKLDDGQLDESDLTFGDLTRVKSAVVDALVGYYHTRVSYPGFPGPQPESA